MNSIHIQLSAFADESDNMLKGQIEALHRNKISLLEMRGVNGKNVIDLTEEEVNEDAALLQNEGIQVWSIGSPLGKVDITIDFDQYLDKVKRTCEIAQGFQCDKIRMFSFYNAYNQRNRVLEYLQRMVEVGDSYGVKMCHENEKDIYGDILSRNLDLLDHVPGLHYVYDPANYLQVGEKAMDTLTALKDRTIYFHIKDVITETGELVPAGYGDGHLQELVAGIKEDKVLTIEPHLAIFKGYADIDGTAMKNKFHFDSNETAFDAAVKAIKEIITNNGYVEKEGVFTK